VAPTLEKLIYKLLWHLIKLFFIITITITITINWYHIDNVVALWLQSTTNKIILSADGWLLRVSSQGV
jgi:hypothetical protein